MASSPVGVPDGAAVRPAEHLVAELRLVQQSDERRRAARLLCQLVDERVLLLGHDRRQVSFRLESPASVGCRGEVERLLHDVAAALEPGPALLAAVQTAGAGEGDVHAGGVERADGGAVCRAAGGRFLQQRQGRGVRLWPEVEAALSRAEGAQQEGDQRHDQRAPHDDQTDEAAALEAPMLGLLLLLLMLLLLMLPLLMPPLTPQARRFLLLLATVFLPTGTAAPPLPIPLFLSFPVLPLPALGSSTDDFTARGRWLPWTEICSRCSCCTASGQLWR